MLTLPGRPKPTRCHAIGLYPSEGNPWDSPGFVNDGKNNDEGWDKPDRRKCVDKEECDSRPEFERALCVCIKDMLRNLPRFHLRPITYMCPQFRDDIWNCALRKVPRPLDTIPNPRLLPGDPYGGSQYGLPYQPR